MAAPEPPALLTVPGLDADALALAIVQHTSDHFAVLDHDFTFIACNENLTRTLGWSPQDLLGRPGLDLVDPSDLERAAAALSLARPHGAPSGVSIMALRRGDGSRVEVHIAATDIEFEGRRLILLSGRPVYLPSAVDSILDGLLGGAPVAELLAPVVECFAWRENGSHVAIAWSTGDSVASVDTGLDPALTGASTSDRAPWADARRRRTPVMGPVDDLEGAVADAARRQGFLQYWVEPVDDVLSAEPALVTVWTTVEGYPPPGLHATGMQSAKRYVELVMRWTDQVQRLEQAAHHDALTGLANRRRFLDAIDEAGRGGVVLYCDLDGFKQVNDGLGHAAGDATLAEVGRRIDACVRDGDLVARLGGDEFAVVLWSASPAEGERVAERIRASCTAPIAIGDAQVTVGISIGIALDADRLSTAIVDRADAALYADKVRRREALDRG